MVKCPQIFRYLLSLSFSLPQKKQFLFASIQTSENVNSFDSIMVVYDLLWKYVEIHLS